MNTWLLSVYCYFSSLFASDEEGQDLIEYALIIAVLVLAAILAMGTLGTKINGMWTSISGKLVVPS